MVNSNTGYVIAVSDGLKCPTMSQSETAFGTFGILEKGLPILLIVYICMLIDASRLIRQK